jgi:LPS export ABC transporter protein LptC/lipopolysaccharide transport protein LptA
MQEVTRRRSIGIGLRTHVPLLTRILAVVLAAAGIGFVGVSYYKLRNRPSFTLRPKAAELSKEVTGIVENYQQRVTKDGRLYLLVKASKDITFSDSHHELENVSVAVYPPQGEVPDQITAAKAIYQPTTSVISFSGNVKIDTKDRLKVSTEALQFDQTAEIAQTDSPVTFERDNVSGKSVGAIVTQKTKRLDLKKDVELTVAPKPTNDPNFKNSTRSRPVLIKGAYGVFEHESLKIEFSGGVTVEQERDILSGDILTAILTKDQKLEKAEIRNNGYLRTMEPGRAAEVRCVNMDFFLDKDQRLQRAVAMTNVVARSLDSDSDMQISGTNALEFIFQAKDDASLLKQMYAGGRSIVTLSAPKSKANDPRATSKRITADALRMTWRLAGRDLERAEAMGNAELYIEPAVSNPRADKKTLTASLFDCDFFETGNLAKTCKALTGAKAVVEPVQATPNRGTRTLTSANMTTYFVRETQDVERIDADGNAKFNENDRNGIASNMIYTGVDQIVKLRGGEPTVWDSRGRTKAQEMDSDLANHVSYGRGKVTTTYYSQEQTNGATPFSKAKSPVFIVSDRAELQHDSGLATYIGNARAWQDDNFVRGDKMNLFVNDKRMDASGHVQTAIYNSKKKVENNVAVVPVFATSDSMFYSDPDRTIHYEGDVDIKQGTDRMTGSVADVYLSKQTNEMEKTIAQKNVVLTQPSRKGTGDWVEYTAATEIAILKGNPARVEDAENGTTEGGRLTLSVRDSKVTADDARGPLSPGRVRSTHKIRKPE